MWPARSKRPTREAKAMGEGAVLSRKSASCPTEIPAARIVWGRRKMLERSLGCGSGVSKHPTQRPPAKLSLAGCGPSCGKGFEANIKHRDSKSRHREADRNEHVTIYQSIRKGELKLWIWAKVGPAGMARRIDGRCRSQAPAPPKGARSVLLFLG